MTETAVFAAGCFWGVQDYFNQVPGVKNTEVGYTGGVTENPTYESVCTGTTDHAEALKIEFDPEVVKYKTLLKHFFKMHDATQYMRQGPDVGSQYRSAIFYANAEQKETAKTLLEELNSKQPKDKPLVTMLEKLGEFYSAEDYHQEFVKKNGYGACHVAYKPIS